MVPGEPTVTFGRGVIRTPVQKLAVKGVPVCNAEVLRGIADDAWWSQTVCIMMLQDLPRPAKGFHKPPKGRRGAAGGLLRVCLSRASKRKQGFQGLLLPKRPRYSRIYRSCPGASKGCQGLATTSWGFQGLPRAFKLPRMFKGFQGSPGVPKTPTG